MPELILASRSPRRALLLRDAGYVIRCVDPPFHDPPSPEGEDPAALAAHLAQAKASSVLSCNDLQLDDQDVVLAADTIVVSPTGRLLGQPGDLEEARDILSQLMGRTHRVVTGVHLASLARPLGQSLVDIAEVDLGQLSENTLRAYLDGQHWRGKAGGYNWQELRDHWPLTVRGDPTTVVGLPMRQLKGLLDRWLNPDTD